MTQQPIHPEQGPTPEQLAAFAEGELDPAASDWVRAWLADRGDEQDLLLLPWLRESVPCEPSEEAWNATLAHIHERVFTPQRPPLRPRWGLRVLVGLAVTATAAALAGVWLIPPWLGTTKDSGGLVQSDPDVEPFPVASAAEVNIISIHPNDADAVVMGIPLLGPLEWVQAEEIEGFDADPHPSDGQVPWLMEDGPVPLILVQNVDR
jgi:hypothetical protein